LAQRATFGRRWAFVYGHGVLLLWFLVNAAVWKWSGREDLWMSGGAMTEEPLNSDYSLVALLFFATSVFSSVDPVMQAFANATMQTYFPERPKLACAAATPRFFYAIGFSCQQFLAIGIAQVLNRPALSEQCLLQGVLVVLSALSLYILHTRVAGIDGKLPVSV